MFTTSYLDDKHIQNTSNSRHLCISSSPHRIIASHPLSVPHTLAHIAPSHRPRSQPAACSDLPSRARPPPAEPRPTQPHGRAAEPANHFDANGVTMGALLARFRRVRRELGGRRRGRSGGRDGDAHVSRWRCRACGRYATPVGWYTGLLHCTVRDFRQRKTGEITLTPGVTLRTWRK